MKQKIAILTPRRSFLHVQQAGKKFRGTYVSLLVAQPVPGHAVIATSRVGFTVSRRVGCAVVRNKVRRRLKEIMRERLPLLIAHCDHVVVAFPCASAIDFHALEKDLQGLLQRAQTWSLLHTA